MDAFDIFIAVATLGAVTVAALAQMRIATITPKPQEDPLRYLFTDLGE